MTSRISDACWRWNRARARPYYGGSWYTRNYSVFIGGGSRTALRSAYRGPAMHLSCMVRQWNHTRWPHSLSQYFRCALAIGHAGFREHGCAISSAENVFGNVNHQLSSAICSSNDYATLSVLRDKTFGQLSRLIFFKDILQSYISRKRTSNK